MKATVCQKCTFMRAYGEDLDKLQTAFEGTKNLDPCSNCGTGEMRIIECNIDGWCDECCKHKSQCKCYLEERKKGITKADLKEVLKELKNDNA